MLITSNIKEVLESFDALIKEFERKAEEAVRRYASEVVYRIASLTVQGDDVKDAALYDARIYKYASLGLILDPVKGFAAGSWTASLDTKPTLQVNNSSDPASAAKFDAASSMQAYKLGQTVFIKNTGPYIKEVDTKYQGSGGFLPLGVRAITEIYKADFVEHFKES